MKIKWMRRAALIFAILLILAGICQNGPAGVKNKAVRICYECIGIG